MSPSRRCGNLSDPVDQPDGPEDWPAATESNHYGRAVMGCPMPQARDWSPMREMSDRLARERTGKDLTAWKRAVQRQGLRSEEAARKWLTEHDVVGYPRMFVLMECFGYPDYVTASADDLVDGQYRDRAHLRPIYESILRAVSRLDGVEVQARKTYVSLLTPRRTFARIQPTTKDRVDLGFRLANARPGGRLLRSRIHDSLSVQVGLVTARDVDAEVKALLRRAYEESR